MPAITRRDQLRRALDIVETSCASNVQSGISVDEPEGWQSAFASWVLDVCDYRDSCFGGVGSLYLHFAEWCATGHLVAPCTGATFERLLTDADFLIVDGMVPGLILREDVEAADDRQITTKPEAAPLSGRKPFSTTLHKTTAQRVVQIISDAK